jgi:uncharacterized protein (TIGR02757 family)
MLDLDRLKPFLDRKVDEYNTPAFIEKDPIVIPHRFADARDKEISGFFAAILAWGNRTSIINSCNRLLKAMDEAPYDFVRHHTPADLKPLMGFVHRTFNATDLFYLLEFLQYHYSAHNSLENAFARHLQPGDTTVENALRGFYQYVFSLEHPERTHKHIATPAKKSACKRLNMYLRWMVRRDKKGVDFGIWRQIKPAQLVCPMDVHVSRVAARYGLMESDKTDWNAALELTAHLRELDPADPVKYDFALFALGVIEKFK